MHGHAQGQGILVIGEHLHTTVLASTVDNLPNSLQDELEEYIEKPSRPANERLESFINSGGAIFNAVDLKITDNGSLVLQLAPDNDLLGLREGLMDQGRV